MASAYELMLVLRGRNYLSNDLRRAGSDLRRLQTQGGLQAQRGQLQVNAQRLASTRAIAQAELSSVTSGTRRMALTKAIAASETAQANALQNVRRLEESIEKTEAARLRNSANLSRLNRQVQTGRPARGFTIDETRQLRQAAAVQSEVLASQAATQARQLEIARAAQTAGLISTQQLIEKEAELAQRQQILTDRINTTTAAEDLNTRKLNENALAMRRLPFERFAAGARYVEHLGRTFQTLGFFATAALAVTAHAASQFQTQTTLAATQATVVGNRTPSIVQANARDIQQQIQQMLNRGQTAVKPEDLTQGLYNVYSGITLQGNQKQQINEGIDIIKQFSRVYTANYGQVEFNDVVKAGIALINNFGLSTRQLPGVLNRMQASVRFGALTMGDFVGSLNQVVPAFRGAHFGFDQMAADIAFVSRLFPSLRFGTTGLSRLTEILSNRKTITGIKEQLGLDIAPGGHLLPLNQIVADIIKARPQLAKGGVDLTNFFKTVSGQQGTVQARRVFVGFATNMKLYDTIARQVQGDNQELAKSFTDMSQTPQVRWAEFTNELRGLVLEIGTKALPVFTELAGPIEKAVHWFDSLDESTKKNIVRFATWGSILALAGGTMLIVVGALGRMYAAIRLLLLGKAGVAALENGFIGAGTALRVGLLGGLILMLPILIRYHDQVGRVVNALGGFRHVLSLIIALMALWKIRTILVGLTTIAAEAGTARAAIALLAGELSALAVLGPIAVAVIVGIEYKQIGGPINKHVIQPISRALNKVLPGSPFGDRSITQATIMEQLNAAQNPDEVAKITKAADTFGTAAARASADAFQKAYDKKWDAENTKRTHTPGYDAFIKTIQQQKVADQEASLEAQRNRMRQGLGRGTTAPLSSGLPGFDVNAAIANVEKLRKAAEKAPSIKNYLAYEKALNALQSKYSGDQLTALNDYLNSIESAETKSDKKRVSNAKKAESERVKAAKAAQKEILNAAKTLQDQYQSLYQTNQAAFGTLFQGPFVNSPQVQNRLQYGAKLTGKDLLADIRSQVRAFGQWRRLLAQLRRRGITGDLYDQIVAAGPGSIDEVRALLSLGKADLRSYAKAFQTGENMIAGATQQDMNLSLTRYRKYGRNIALQIIQGLRDEHTPVLKVFEDMIIKDFPGLAQKAGKNTTPTKTGTSTRPPVGNSKYGGAQIYEPHTHYHVTAPMTEHSSIQTQLRHASFASRTKHLNKPLP